MDFKNINEGYADGEEPLHYYYNREERIKRAPKIVQDFYAGKVNQFSKNPFKTIFKNKIYRTTFIFLLLFCGFAYFMNWRENKNALKIGETSANLSAFSYSEEVYVSLKFESIFEKSKPKSSKENFVPTTISVIFNAVDSSGTVVQTSEFSDSYNGNELFIRTQFKDYDIIKVVADVTFGEEKKSFSAKVVQQ